MEAELRARASLDDSQFQSSIKNMQKSTDAFASGALKRITAGVAGAFGVGMIASWTKSIMASADQIKNMAATLRVSAEHYQTLMHVAKMGGVEGQMTGALQHIARAQDEALAGNEKLQKAFADLGISLAEIGQLSPAEIFERISKALNDSTITAEENAAASDVLGRQYVMLRDVMASVANDGLDNMAASLRQTNVIMSDETLSVLQRAQQEFETLGAQIKAVFADAIVWVIKFTKALTAAMGYWSSGASFMEGIRLAGEQVDKEFASLSKTTPAPPVAPITKPPQTTPPPQKPPPTKPPQTSERGRSATGRGAGGASADTWQPSLWQPWSSDSLARIGLMLGGQVRGDLLSVAHRQLEIQEHIRRLQEQAAQAAERTADNTEALRD